MKARPSTRLRNTAIGKRPWTTAADRSKSTLTRSLQDEITKYEKICENYEKQNHQLRVLIANLKKTDNLTPFLQTNFDKRISKLQARVSDRLLQLSSMEKDSKSSRVLFSGTLDDKSEKTKLLRENDRLVQIALHQEQRALVDRLKLRVYHDHRQLFRIRELFERAKNGEQIHEIDEEDENRRIQLHNLKAAIEYEKWRIASLQSDQSDVNEAATLIQKTWRGYLQRLRSRKTDPAPPVEVKSEAGSEIPMMDFSSQLHPLSDEEDLTEEDMGMDEALPSDGTEESFAEEESDHVFDVTGVPTAEDTMCCEEQTEEEIEEEIEETEEEDIGKVPHPDAPADAGDNQSGNSYSHSTASSIPPTIFDDFGLLPRMRLPAQNETVASFPKN